jgi:hypothetical protein
MNEWTNEWNITKQKESISEGKAEVLGEKLVPRSLLFYHKLFMDWPVTEPGNQQGESRD